MSEEGVDRASTIVEAEQTQPDVRVARKRPDTQIPEIVAQSGPAHERAPTRMQTSDPFSLRGIRSPLVGRTDELAQMRRAIADVGALRRPALITVFGNQGTGKSRLIDEVLHGLPSQTLFYRCTAAAGGAKYSTIAKLLRARFAISDTASEGELIDEFRREVQEVFGDQRVAEVLHVLGGFLNLQFPDSPFLRVLGENPKQYEEVARTVLRRFVEVDGGHGPIVLVVDDLHQADEGSLSLLRELSMSLHDSPVTLLVGARPELMVRTPEWGEHVTEHVRIELRNLDTDDAEAMFRSLLSRCESVPEEIVEDAVEMTGGNAYFLDQLVRLFLANGTISADVLPWQINVDRAMETDLPITVEEAIEARIAALERDERAVLEKGAVFGNVFWAGAVVALTRIEREASRDPETPAGPAGPLDFTWGQHDEEVRGNIAECLEELVGRDYLLKLDEEDSTVAGDVEFVFKHNLERELIAKSTERTKLGRYYRLAAQWIETKSAARSEEQLEFLGQLYERGGDLRRAAHSYIAGGDKARQRYANEQAVELYRKGLAFLEEDDGVLLLDALHNLGSVLDLVGETREAQRHFSKMLKHAWLLDHRAKGGAAHNRLGRIHRRLGEYDEAMAHLRTAHELFKAANDRRGVAGTLDDIGQVHWLRGVYAQALEFHRQALALRRAIGDERSIALSLANIGRVHRETGGFKAASKQFYEALALRRKIGDTAGVIQSLCDLARVHSADGEYEKALAMYEEARGSAAGIGDKLALTQVLSGLGQCQAASGKYSDAIESLLEGKSTARSLGNQPGAAECYRHLAETYLHIGDRAQALDNAQRSLELGTKIGSRLHVGSAHRVIAEATFGGGRDPETLARANEHFRKAIEILSGMKHELELARTYRSYAVHREHTGHAEEAETLRRRSDEIFGRLRGAANPE